MLHSQGWQKASFVCITKVPSIRRWILLPPATKLGQGNIFRSVCQQFCPQGGMRGCLGGHACVVLFGGHAWFYSGVCMVLFGGVHGFIRGACMVLVRGCAWFYSGGCVVLFRGACVVLFGGHVWFYSGEHVWFYSGGVRGFIQGGMHGFIIRGHVWFYSGHMCGFIQGGAWFFQFFGYNEIRSMSGRYASYWNAYLLLVFVCVSSQGLARGSCTKHFIDIMSFYNKFYF